MNKKLCASTWEEASLPPALSADEVHVWQVALAQPAARIAALRRLLSPDEQERAGRFVSPRLGAHFTVARGALRTLLGHYLATAPESLRFRYNPSGKPALEKGALRFNLSHSGELALCAFSLGRELGIDVERRRTDLDIDALAGRFFSPLEIAALGAVPPELRQAAFFDCWTRKEAYLKARGEGITGLALDSFSVSLLPGEPPALLHCDRDPLECSRWALGALCPGPSYAAALCVAGAGWQPKSYRWVPR